MSIWGPATASLPRAQGASPVGPARVLTLHKGPDLHPEFLASYPCKGPNLSQGSWLSPWIPGVLTLQGSTIHKGPDFRPEFLSGRDCSGEWLQWPTTWIPYNQSGGQYSLFYKPSSFSPNLHQGLGGILWPVCPMMLRTFIPRSGKQFLDNKKHFLENIFSRCYYWASPCNPQPRASGPSVFLVCYSPGTVFLLSLSSHI